MKSRTFGFTLIELLVVIAIIAILAAILFPVFATAREKARQSACSSNFKQMGLAMVQYTQDYDECPPNGVTNTNCAGGWAGQIYPYLKSRAVYVCPDDQTPGASCSYAYNRNIQNYNATGHTYGMNSWPSYTLAKYANVSKTVLLAEITGSAGYDVSVDTACTGALPAQCSFSPDGMGGAGSDFDPYVANNNLATNKACSQQSIGCAANFTLKYVTGYPSVVSGNYAQLFTGPTGIHSGGANYLMADGHVKWFNAGSVSAGSNNTGASSSCGSGTTAAATGCTQAGAAATWSLF
ncbi:MAG: DUF1559 domain-containing protein [Capsulimonadaceae bacterium]|nr:DUF1559 domain-containing protein [Capsulimonadaceae bacterium]